VAAECHSRFGFTFQRKITAAFDGGEITSDAGLVLVREFDERLGLTAALRGAVPDDRDRRYVTHDVLTLLRQRVYQIAAGYEDANDATYLRHDPTLRPPV
jgi:Transposase DDE domain group 1